MVRVLDSLDALCLPLGGPLLLPRFLASTGAAVEPDSDCCIFDNPPSEASGGKERSDAAPFSLAKTWLATNLRGSTAVMRQSVQATERQRLALPPRLAGLP